MVKGLKPNFVQICGGNVLFYIDDVFVEVERMSFIQ